MSTAAAGLWLLLRCLSLLYDGGYGPYFGGTMASCDCKDCSMMEGIATICHGGIMVG